MTFAPIMGSASSSNAYRAVYERIETLRDLATSEPVLQSDPQQNRSVRAACLAATTASPGAPRGDGGGGSKTAWGPALRGGGSACDFHFLGHTPYRIF